MTPVPPGLRTWLAAGLCAVEVCASLLTLVGPVAAGRWLVVGTVAVLALAALLAAIRARATRWWLPTLVGLAVVGFSLLAEYASPPGRFQVLPGAGSLARLGDTIRTGLEYANASRPPVEATRPLELLIVGGALLILLIVDLTALGLLAPAVSGLIPLGLWLPGIALGRPANGWAFALAGGAYLLLLGLTAAPPPGARTPRLRADGARRARVAAAGATAVLLAAALLAPAARSAPGWSTVRFPQLGSAATGSLQLAQDLNLRESLGARSSEVVLTYRADPVTVGPLRLFTLRDFNGENWSRDARARVITADSALLWPARDLADRPTDEPTPTASRLTVRIAGLREDRLPVPVMPRTVDANGRWSYDAERDEVTRQPATEPGLVYSMTVKVLDLTAASLRRIRGGYPADLDRYLAVPRTSRTARVAAVAAQVTAGASGPYEQALALQSYLRNAQNFTYATDVPAARTDDAVWDFLGSRTGYCVQFATAMTVMARMVGIPARLGVGYLPGTLDQTGAHVVTGRDSHAWPELYFPGAGWVRFEPTPAVQSGAPPLWADPSVADASRAAPAEGRSAGAGGAPATAATPAPKAAAAVRGQGMDPGLRLGLGAAGAVVALAATGWFILRRRSARAGDVTPEAAWGRLRAGLRSAGITWTDARTPRQVETFIAAELERCSGAPMHAEALVALHELALAVQAARYAPSPAPWQPGQLERDVDLVVREGSGRREPSGRPPAHADRSG
jgi:transglutaminase-like putative cysteine protease